jgi:hypothetical protein
MDQFSADRRRAKDLVAHDAGMSGRGDGKMS